jgi:hypothetical protein
MPKKSKSAFAPLTLSFHFTDAGKGAVQIEYAGPNEPRTHIVGSLILEALAAAEGVEIEEIFKGVATEPCWY